MSDSLYNHTATHLQKIKTAIRPWFVVLSAGLFFFYSHIQLNIFNVINISLMSNFHISASISSKLAAITLLATLTFVCFAGMLIDRFSTRKIILTAMLFSCGGTTLLAISHSLTQAFVARFIVGIGSAFCFLSCIRLASRWFSTKSMAIVTSVLVAMATTGGMIAQKPAAVLMLLYGWRNMLILNVALGLIIMIWIWLFVKNYPFEDQKKIKQQRDKLLTLGVLNSLKKSYLNSKNWICGLYTSLLNLPFWIFGASWGNPFLIQTHHLDASIAADIISMLYLGIIIGSPISGWISDLMSTRKILMYIGAAVSLILLLIIIYVNSLSISKLKVLFFLEGFFTSTQIISYAMVAEINPQSVTATSISVISFSTIGIGGLFQLIFGIVMDNVSKPDIINSIPVYTHTAYSFSLTILPICAFICLGLVRLMNETYCKPYALNS